MKKNIQKTLFIVIEIGFQAQSLLRSDIFKELKNSKHKIIILSPASQNENFKSEFKGKNIYHEYYDYESYRYSKIFSFFEIVTFLSFNSETMKFWRKVHLSNKRGSSFLKRSLNLFLKLIIKIVTIFPKLILILNRIESFLSKNIHQDLFEKYKPSLVITSSLGNMGSDRFIMHESRKNKVKVCTVILSWDNSTTRGLRGANADYIVSWTTTMKDELVKYHNLKQNDIFVGGVPKYDAYFNYNEQFEESFKSNFNFKPNFKTIFLCLESPTGYKWNIELINIISEVIENEFNKKVRLIIRPHPIYFKIKNGKYIHLEELETIREICKNYNFIIFDELEIVSKELSFDLHHSDPYKLKTLLKHSDVVVCFYSSIMVEASICNTPVINVEIFEKGKTIYKMPNEIAANYIHNSRILSTGGISRAKTKEEMINLLKIYLRDKSILTKERKLISDNESGPNRGKAGKVISEYILQLVDKK